MIPSLSVVKVAFRLGTPIAELDQSQQFPLN